MVHAHALIWVEGIDWVLVDFNLQPRQTKPGSPLPLPPNRIVSPAPKLRLRPQPLHLLLRLHQMHLKLHVFLVQLGFAEVAHFGNRLLLLLQEVVHLDELIVIQ